MVGTIDEAGLAVLDQIAAAGNDGSPEPSPDGGPRAGVIESMTAVVSSGRTPVRPRR